jgi:thioester reductase-like protein
VRAASVSQGRARLRAQLLNQNLKWPDSDSDPKSEADAKQEHTRIVVVIGDLSQPKLGVSESEWKSLGARVSCVVHNGATVNHALPYTTLKATNVNSTIEVIRFARYAPLL